MKDPHFSLDSHHHKLQNLIEKRTPKKIHDHEPINTLTLQKKSHKNKSKIGELHRTERSRRFSSQKKKKVSSAFDSVNISVKMIGSKSLRQKREKRVQLCTQIDGLNEEELRFILMKVGIQTSKEVPRLMLVSLAKCYFFT